MLLYGKNVIKEVLKKGGRRVYEIYIMENIKDVGDIISEAKKKNIKINFVDRTKLFKITKTDKSQGIAANVEGVKNCKIDEFILKNKKNESVIVAALDDVSDPHNVGAVIRNAEVFGVTGIVLTGKSAPVNDAVFKVSSGAVEYLDIIRVTNLNSALREFKNAGFWVYGFDASAEKRLDEIEFDKKSILVFGSEGKGMKRLVKENCDFLLKIKQKGNIDSLNISNAAAVAFYEAMKKNDILRREY